MLGLLPGFARRISSTPGLSSSIKAPEILISTETSATIKGEEDVKPDIGDVSRTNKLRAKVQELAAALKRKT
uniref:Uncharacterized protein n=1 Tax=Oryza punctata TaxID=4537 RepID=A0A0E0JZF0_ORYPU